VIAGGEVAAFGQRIDVADGGRHGAGISITMTAYLLEEEARRYGENLP